MKPSSNTLGLALRDFFREYLPRQRGMSVHTIHSYRDSLKLLLQFLAYRKNTSPSNLSLQAIEVDDVLAFLEHLEQHRHNTPRTRNIRLAALHCFFRFFASRNPEYLDLSQRILSIPFKRSTTGTVEYLESEEITALFQSVDQSKPDGRRDYVLLVLMFNTGARVHEIVSLKANDLVLSRPFSVHIFGKGRKARICPIWSETAHLLRTYMEERELDPQKPVPLFLNHLGLPLTRFGVRYLVAKYVRKAAKTQPSLRKKRLHPHSVRHSTAVHLLKSGVDLSTIAHWLGHASINTTNRYTAIDLEMKRQALANAKPLQNETGTRFDWKDNPDILAWLESL